jgi:sulfite oxidase
MDLVSYCSADETKQLDYSSEQPLNREPSPQALIEQYDHRNGQLCFHSNSSNSFYQYRFLTPQDIGYDRNHGAIPHIRAEKHVVRVDGRVKTPISLSPDQLRSEFPQQQVVCALECAGNRRHTMRTMMREVEGIDWGDAAVMNCKFKGPRIRDVLLRAGLGDDILDPSRETHVAFACYQVRCQQDHWFGSSVKLEKCMQEDGDAILALEVREPFPVLYHSC